VQLVAAPEETLSRWHRGICVSDRWQTWRSPVRADEDDRSRNEPVCERGLRILVLLSGDLEGDGTSPLPIRPETDGFRMRFITPERGSVKISAISRYQGSQGKISVEVRLVKPDPRAQHSDKEDQNDNCSHYPEDAPFQWLTYLQGSFSPY
jgi:hypothetical protein